MDYKEAAARLRANPLDEDAQQCLREHMDEMQRRIECPLPWCTGQIESHGGDGSAPDEWLHQAEPIPLPLGELQYSSAFVTLCQLGAGPVTWDVFIKVEDPEVPVRAIVKRLRATADLLEALEVER